MSIGYPTRVALTSLALLLTLNAAAPEEPVKAPGRCSDIHRLYAPRVLRELRAQLRLAYAESHAARARLVLEALQQRAPAGSLMRMEQIRVVPHESDDPRMKHLLAYVAINCL